MSNLIVLKENDYFIGKFDTGEQLLFDQYDLLIIESHKWFIDSCGYVSTSIHRKRERLHRILLASAIPYGFVVDHINRNKLDNRRNNLRICTQKENTWNTGLSSNNKSGITGVHYAKPNKKWRAQIMVNGKIIDLGLFDTIEAAAEKRKEAEKIYRSVCVKENVYDL